MMRQKPVIAKPTLPEYLARCPAQVTTGAGRACKKELFKPKILPHCGGFWGVNDLPLPCVWPGAAFGQSTVFTALLGLCLNFHMEQEGELMLHYESSSARAAANLNQVIQRSKWAYVLLGPGQVEMCYWCITKRNAGKESSHISFYRDASWFSDSPDYVTFNEAFVWSETSEDQKVVTDFVSASAFIYIHVFF